MICLTGDFFLVLSEMASNQGKYSRCKKELVFTVNIFDVVFFLVHFYELYSKLKSLWFNLKYSWQRVNKSELWNF